MELLLSVGGSVSAWISSTCGPLPNLLAGDVGVGGLLLGGGLSFLSAQYGLACDSIVNYEVGKHRAFSNNTPSVLFKPLG